MVLDTRHFGTIEVEENDIINFEFGIPGFNELKKFAILGETEKETPFKWLQSIESNDLAFVIIDPLTFRKDYSFDVDDNSAEYLEIDEAEEILVYSIVTIPEDITKMTANLRAPIIINAKKNKGAQVVLEDEKFKFKHLILEELQKQEVK